MHCTECVISSFYRRVKGDRSSYSTSFSYIVNRLIDTAQRPTYLQQRIQNWLGIVMHGPIAVIAVALVGIAVGWTDKFDAGSVRVSLVMVVTF